MQRIEDVDLAHAASTKELGPKAIEATVHALLAAEFTLAIGKYPVTFESDTLGARGPGNQ